MIFAEFEKVNSIYTDLHPMHIADNAQGVSDVLAGLLEGDAVGGEQGRSCD